MQDYFARDDGQIIAHCRRLWRRPDRFCETRPQPLVTGTIYSHLAEAVEGSEAVKLARFFPGEEQQRVAAAFEKLGSGSLGRVFESLGGAIDYGRLRIFRAAANARA